VIEAYGESPELQEIANLVIVMGNRDDIREMTAAQEVLKGCCCWSMLRPVWQGGHTQAP
jgi:hypothetical protein